MADMNVSRAFLRDMAKLVFRRPGAGLVREIEATLPAADRGIALTSAMKDYADLSKILRGQKPERKYSALNQGGR